MTEFERIVSRSFIAARRWQFASTMPDNPHWYTVRKWGPEGETDFEEFVRILRRCGDDEVFEGFHYWTMGAPISETTVINRKPLRAG